jgi:hypothetical protein
VVALPVKVVLADKEDNNKTKDSAKDAVDASAVKDNNSNSKITN